jgi:mannose-6-phosphate isomerase
MASQTMGEMTVYPLLLAPALHTRVWGGRKLESTLHKRLPTSDPYGESWEMHDTVLVANGEYAGVALGNLLDRAGSAVIGDASDPRDGFPLLLKFLDADAWLSVQVHPDDAMALEMEGEPRGKTEAWIVLAAEPGARIALGVVNGLTREGLAEVVRTNSFQTALRYVPVSAGDVIYLSAGTVHALGPGVLVYEIQQSSDQTYRLYDWGRVGLDGQPRPLHIGKGLMATKPEQRPAVTRMPETGGLVLSGPYFETYLYRLQGEPVTLDTAGRRFHVLSVISGNASITAGGVTVEAALGQSVLIPAAAGAYTVSGPGDVLRSSQPL